MFSDNEKISARQLYRAIVVTLAGPTLLVCPKIVEGFGADGIFVYLMAGGLSALYIGLVIMCRKKWYTCKEGREGFLGRVINILIRVVESVKLLVLAVLGLHLMVDIISAILLPETYVIVILLPIIAGLIYWNMGSIETISRAFELLFYWIIVPITIVLLVAIPKVDYQNIIPTNGAGFSDMIRASLLIWVLFTPAELIVLCGKHYKNNKKTYMAIWRGVVVVFVGNIITYETILGIYGTSGLNNGGTYPLLKVMQISGIPGDFLRRVDGLMSVFLVLSLFCSLVMLKNFLTINIWSIKELIWKKKYENEVNERKKIILSMVITFIMVVGVMAVKNKFFSDNKYSIESAVNDEKRIISLVELEQRGFVMSVIIGDRTITFELASDESGQWQNKSDYVTLKTDRVWEAEALYKENGEKHLDFTHMKMIFIDETAYGETDILENLRYMYEKEQFAENTLICVMGNNMKKEAAKAMDEGIAFAVKIENIMEVSGKGEGMELYRVYNRILSEK